jgi:hypothetical protein
MQVTYKDEDRPYISSTIQAARLDYIIAISFLYTFKHLLLNEYINNHDATSSE